MQILRFYLQYAKPYRVLLIIGIIILCIVNYLEVLIPHVLKNITDLLNSEMIHKTAIQSLLYKLIVISACAAIARLLWRLTISGSSRRIVSHMRKDLFAHFLKLDSTYYHHAEIGDLMARSTNDLSNIGMLGSMGIVTIVDSIVLSSMIISQLFSLNLQLALLLLIPFPLITITAIYISKIAKPVFKKIQESFSQLSQQVQEVFTGIRVVKTFVKEDYFLNRFENANTLFMKHNMNVTKYWERFDVIIMFLSGITQIILLYFGGYYAIAGNFSLGDIVAGSAYLSMLIWPFMSVGWSIRLIQEGSASLRRIIEIMHIKPHITSPPNAIKQTPSGEFTISQLFYTYPNAPNAQELQEKKSGITAMAHHVETDTPQNQEQNFSLYNINFTIKKGEVIGILGPTGSGKSTLLHLLCYTLEVESQNIFADSIDITEYDLFTYRSGIGFIPQQSFLFSRSIKENITFALDDDIDEKQIQDICNISNLTPDLALFPQGLDTQIGERGISLSGGQKQRVALARALIMNPNILIMDDSLSALDTETEANIISKIFVARTGKTTIFVSNRINTLAKADKIIVLQNGTITQHGTAQELMQDTQGFYHEIYQLQQSS